MIKAGLKTTKVSGVGQSKQIRLTATSRMRGIPIDFNVKLAGNPGADLLVTAEKGVAEANRIIADMLAIALDEAMESVVWMWSDGASRDIIDTGALKKSRTITVEGPRIMISYNLPYAALVHYGGYVLPYGNRNAQRVYLPGRPWVQSVVLGGGPIPRLNFEEIYEQAIERAFK